MTNLRETPEVIAIARRAARALDEGDGKEVRRLAGTLEAQGFEPEEVEQIFASEGAGLHLLSSCGFSMLHATKSSEF